MREHVVIGAMLLVGLEAQAAPVLLGEDELRLAVTGKTVNIDTPLGLPITVNYGANGIMTGSVGTALGVYLGGQKDRGRWSVRNGKLCQKWFKWLDSETNCLTIRQDGLKIHWQSDQGKTGTAMIETGPPVLAGASASGLGLPQPIPSNPARSNALDLADDEARRRASEPAPTEHAGQPGHPSARSAPSQPATRLTSKAVGRAERSAQRGVEPAVADRSDRAEAPAHRSEVLASIPELIETPAVVERQSPPVVLLKVKSAAAPVLLASLGPSWAAAPGVSVLAAPPAVSVLGEPAVSELSVPADVIADLFNGDIQPMRSAADLATIDALEHRWCLGNALGRGPALPAHMMLDPATVAIAVDAPSLLAVVQEQAYEGDLPLYEPACLTLEPAIGVAAKLISTVR